MRKLEIKYGIQQKIIFLLIFFGVLLSIIQFICNRSLWIDESILALNIIHKSPSGLFKPLDYNVVAPILFLQIEHFLTVLLGNSAYSLRIFPLLCYWCSIYFFYKILKILFTQPFIIIFALAVYLLNQTLIYYSSEVKQYMIDVFIATLLYYILLKEYSHEKNKYILLIITGIIAVFISNITPVLMAAIGTYIIYEYFFIGKKNLKYICYTFISWAITFAAYFYLFIYGHPTKKLMVIYWSKADAFLPLNYHFTQWIIGRFNTIFIFQFHFGKTVEILLILLFLSGIIFLLIYKKKSELILLLMPLSVHMALSGFKLYPFETRLLLYNTPLLIIVFSWGLYYLYKMVSKYIATEPMLLACLLFAAFLIHIIFIHPFPFIQHDEIKGCIIYMKNKTSNNNDNIYSAISANPTIKYYHDINFFKTLKPIVYGDYYPGGGGESTKNLTDLKSLKGRMWIYYIPGLHEEDFIVKFLDSARYKKVDTFTTSGNAVVSLYAPGLIQSSLN